jgi:hypothetical protein
MPLPLPISGYSKAKPRGLRFLAAVVGGLPQPDGLTERSVYLAAGAASLVSVLVSTFAAFLDFLVPFEAFFDSAFGAAGAASVFLSAWATFTGALVLSFAKAAGTLETTELRAIAAIAKVVIDFCTFILISSFGIMDCVIWLGVRL